MFRVSSEVKEAYETMMRIKMYEASILALKREVYYLRVKFDEPETATKFPSSWKDDIGSLQYESAYVQDEEGDWRKRKEDLPLPRTAKRARVDDEVESSESTEYSETDE